MQSPLLAARASLGWELGARELAERIHDRVRSDRPAAVPSSPVYNSPARRARRLFGREPDLARLDEMLVPGSNVRVAASIEGLAGVGKTELALYIVDRLSRTNRFSGGIFWFDAENPDLTVTWGTTIADALAVGSGTVAERAAAAVRIASSGPPVLVVLDNVERWTRESEPRPLPHGAQTALLVTTRHRFLAGPSFVHHTLETLPEDAARSFLSFIADRELTGTGELLRYLDGHTLAIELAGAYLHEFPSVTPAAYLAKLTEGAPVEEKVQDLVRYEATVRRALDVHWAQLDDAAREALLVTACFAPEEASVALLEACGIDAEAQQPLRRFHLISGDGERWRIHRLVREWARRTTSADDLARAMRRFVEGCAEFSRGIDIDDGYRVYRADGAHLEEAAREAERVLGAGDARVGVLFDRLGIALFSLGDLSRAKERLEHALAVTLRLFDEDHPAVASGRSNLALVLRELGELPRAKELRERALASNLKAFGEEHPRVAASRANLASVLQALGELPRAKELLEQALAWSLEHAGEEDPSVATRRANLATILHELGEYERAKQLLEQALAADLKKFGEDHPIVANSRSGLALVLHSLGELPQAQSLLERALASDVKNFGENHPAIANRRFNLAGIFRDLGDLPRARELYEQALTTAERTVGPKHPSTNYIRIALADVLGGLGRIDVARAEAQRALAAVSDQPAGSFFRTQIERAAKRILAL